MKATTNTPSLRNTTFNLEAVMTTKQQVAIKLTAEQQRALEKITGKTGEAIELRVEELEERIAPSFLGSGGIDALADPRPSPILGGDWVILK